MRVEPLSWWVSTFGEVAPVGHVLRRQLQERWTRFHSLPESKRYPEEAAEFDELMARHLSVTNGLFTKGEEIYVYRSHLGEEKLRGRYKHQVAGRQLGDLMFKLPTGIPEEDDLYRVRALKTTWVPDFFNALTKQVANWEESGITFVSPSTRNIYCPYDGGMDVFAFSASLDTLEGRHQTWMSRREDKL